METKDILKQARLNKGLTLEDVGKQVGVSSATISRWESGDIANMKRDKIVKLANALGISPATIMGWDETMSESKSLEDIIINFKKTLSSPELTFNNEPASNELINSIIFALDMGVEMAKRNNLPTQSLTNQNSRVQEAEESYIKSRSMNVQQMDGTASSSIGDTERKVSNQ